MDKVDKVKLDVKIQDIKIQKTANRIGKGKDQLDEIDADLIKTTSFNKKQVRIDTKA